MARAVHWRARMSNLESESRIRSAFGCVRYQLHLLERRWKVTAPIGTIRSIVHAIDRAQTALIDRRAFAPYDELDLGARGLVHDAFMRVLVLAGFLDEALEHEWAEPAAIEHAYEATIELCDVLSPGVSNADRALRRVALEGIEIETARKWMADAPHAPATEEPFASRAAESQRGWRAP